MYRQRFGFTGHPLPKDAHGKTFFDKSPGYQKLERAFRQLVEEPGLGVLTADAGVGKTAAIRNLCAQLPRPDYLVLYLCDTAVAPLDLYRTLATELGVRPFHRRAQLWTDLKKAFLHLVDERGTAPLLILDEAQHFSDPCLIDLRLPELRLRQPRAPHDVAGLPPLARLLRMQQHTPLAMRVVHQVHLEPLDRALFTALIEHGLKAAGATQSVLADPARELLFRASRGVPRVASTLLRRALYLAHERNQTHLRQYPSGI
jgi:type II secretory pathway predicted ATPase ExeA